MGHVDKSFIKINPTTATKLDVSGGEYVRAEPRRSDVVAKATVTDRVDGGTLFIPTYFAVGVVNKLTQEVFDPQANVPKFKISSTCTEPLGPGADPDALWTPDAGAGSAARGDD